MNLLSAPLSMPLRVTQVEMTSDDETIARRLMELGFIEGAVIELRHEAPLFKDPVAVLVRGMVVALRRYEADRITVELASTKPVASDRAS